MRWFWKLHILVLVLIEDVAILAAILKLGQIFDQLPPTFEIYSKFVGLFFRRLKLVTSIPLLVLRVVNFL